MKPLTLFVLLLSISYTMLFFSSCGEDLELCPDPTNPECPDYDPCYLVSPTDAAFIIYDSIYAGWADTALAMPQDTGLLPLVGYKFFRPLHIREGTRYEWRVGLDTRTFTEPVFRLDFSWQQPSVIDVRLIATIEEDPLSCLSVEQRSDTSWQTLTLIDWPDGVDTPIYGEFRGSSTEYADSSYTIKIEWEEFGTLSSAYLYNMQRDCPEKPQRVKILNLYDWFVTDQERSRDRCQNFLAIGKLNDNDHREIKIDYWYDDDKGQRRHYVFTGWRQ